MSLVSVMDDQEVLLHFEGGKPVAYCAGRPVYPARLKEDLTRVAARLQQGDGDVLIVCKSRYALSVGLLASWLAARRVVLPPNRHPATLDYIRKAHRIAVELGDTCLDSGQRPPSQGIGETLELRLPAEQQALTLYTSGSTGSPKPVSKSIGNLFSEGFALRSAMTWPEKPFVASVPPNHLYGLTFSILLPWVLAIPFVDECPLHAHEVAEEVRRYGGGTLVTVPVHLRALLDEPMDGGPSQVVSSAGALDREVAEQWQRRFGEEVLEIYGSSETGVVAWRRQLSDGRWQAFPGVSFDSDDEGLLHVTSSFIDQDEAVPFQTQDRVRMRGERTFELLGRADSIIKIAGKRVSLLTVESALKSCQGVVDAAVAAVPVQGHIRNMAIWAAIAAGDGQGVDARSIRMELQSKLDSIEVPRRIVVLRRLPREENGKLRRERLISLFEGQGHESAV